ncbi:cyclin-domain-containing protein [Pilobolus umbonatus]|nr:cyclin-domain-containing protein [Pilobolus umbonatus]
MPTTFDLAKYPVMDTIRLLASLLERMTAANDLLNKQHQRRSSLQPYTRFHARLVPSIDIHSYLSRILKYCPCVNECFLSLLVYFDRMSKSAISLTGKPFTIDSFNIHRLLISGIMVSSKFFSDVFYTNTRYAKVGGLPVTELNALELEFLKMNSYNMSVSIPELQRYGDQLLKVGYIQEKTYIQDKTYHTRSNSESKIDIDRMCDLTQRMSFDCYQNKRHHQIRKMTSSNSLKESTRQVQAHYNQPRQVRSSVNLTDSSRRLSLTSIHAAPFIPNSDIYQSYIYYPAVGIPTPPSSASPINHSMYL